MLTGQLNNKCTAIITSDLLLLIPCINAPGTTLSAEDADVDKSSAKLSPKATGGVVIGLLLSLIVGIAGGVVAVCCYVKHKRARCTDSCSPMWVSTRDGFSIGEAELPWADNLLSKA